MEVRPGGHAGGAHGGDHLPGLDRVALLHIHVSAVGIHRGEAIPVVQHQIVAPFPVKPHLGDGAVRRRQDDGPLVGGDVDAAVQFSVDDAIGIALPYGPAVLHRPLEPAALHPGGV